MPHTRAQEHITAPTREDRRPSPVRSRLSRVLFTAACAIASFTCALFLELFLEATTQARDGVLSGLLAGGFELSAILRLGLLFVLILLVLLVFWYNRRMFEWVIDHRVIISVIVLAFCVIFQISGSSLAVWGDMLGGDRFQGTYFGIPRSVRSDEWNVLTPFAFSQSWTAYAATSDLLRGGGTDVTMVYALPAWSISTIFRPFLWGYLVLGAVRGLSFFWCARIICLFLMTYELGRIIARDDKYLATFMAILVTFAPAVQWWFAVNGTAELFIFGEGLVVALHRLLRARSAGAQWLHALLLAWFLGCYAFIIYPATQIPCAYVFAAIGIADIISLRKERKTGQLVAARASSRGGVHQREQRSSGLGMAIVALIVCVAASIALCALAVKSSWETIQLVMGTVYPGERIECGGGYAALLHNQATTLVSPINADAYIPNVCEAAMFVCLFPLGIVLCCIFGLKRADAFTICMLLVAIFLWVFAIVGFPEQLAKATMLSHANLARLVYPLALLDIAFLVRALALRDEHLAKPEDAEAEAASAEEHPDIDPLAYRPEPAAEEPVSEPAASLPKVSVAGLVASFAVAIALALGVVLFGRYLAVNAIVMGKWQCLVTFLAFAGLIFSAIAPVSVFAAPGHPARGDHTAMGAPVSMRGQFLIVFALIVVVAGLCVNPLQRGAAALLESDYVAMVEEAADASDDDGIWVADSTVLAQAAIQGGVPVLNTVNTYPNLELWETLDPEGAYADVYNRYAYISVAPTLGETSFELIQPDLFQLNINPDDLARIGVTHYIAMGDLTVFDTPMTHFTPVASEGNFTVYEVETVAANAAIVEGASQTATETPQANASPEATPTSGAAAAAAATASPTTDAVAA